MDLAEIQKKEQILEHKQKEQVQQPVHVHNPLEQEFDVQESAEAVKEKEVALYAALNETYQSFIPAKGATEPVPPVRYQTPSKGKKGRNKRIEDEKKLADLKKEKDIAEVVNHRGMRVVEKMKGTYEPGQEIREQPVLKVKSAVASCLKWVPSMAMAEEKYLADHAEEVKDLFRESLYLEEAMRVPDYKDYFANMDPIQKQLIESNLDAMRGLRRIMKAKLLTMGVLLNDDDYENITADYLTAENATPKQMEKANALLSDEKYAYTANNYRLRVKTERLKKQLDAKNEGRELSQHEIIKMRQEDGALMKDLKGKIRNEVEARFKAKGRTAGNTRFSTSTVARFVTYTNMDFKEAVDMAEALQLNEYVKDERVPLSKMERRQFTRAVEKVFSVINSYDKKLSDKLFADDGFLSCSQEEYEKLKFPMRVSFDFNDITVRYGEVLRDYPQDCALSEEEYINSRAMKDSLQTMHSASNNMDLLYGSKVFFDKNIKIDDFKSKKTDEEMVEWPMAVLSDVPYDVQKKEGINLMNMTLLCGAFRDQNIGDFDSILKDDKKRVAAKYSEDMEKLEKEREEYKKDNAEKFAKTNQYKEQAINTLKEKEKEFKDEGKEYTRREHLLALDTADEKRRKEYRLEVSKAVGEKLGLSDVKDNWRYSISTASNYGIATGAPFDEVVDMAIALNMKGKDIKNATPEERMQFTAAMDRVLDHLDKTDLSLLEKGGTDAQFELSDEEHLKLRDDLRLAMDMDSLMNNYEKVLTLNPEYCGRTDEEYLHSLPIRDVLTQMNQQVVLLDQAYANEYFDQHLPYEKLKDMSPDDVTKEMTENMPKLVPAEAVPGLMALFGDVLYVRAGVSEGLVVPGNIEETMKIGKKKSMDAFHKRREDTKKENAY